MLKNRLREVRHEKGLTAQAMADKLNIRIRSYRNYESGDREPPLETLVTIADILNVSLDYLLCRDEFIRNNDGK